MVKTASNECVGDTKVPKIPMRIKTIAPVVFNLKSLFLTIRNKHDKEPASVLAC